MRSTFPASWLACAALLLVPAVARAEPPAPAPAAPAAPAPAAPSPADAAKKVRAAFGEPSEKAAYSVDLEILVRGQKVGELKSAAVAEAGADGKKVWKGSVALTEGKAAAPGMKSSTTLDRELRVLSEERIEKEGEAENKTTVARNEKGFDVTYTEGAKAPTKSVVEAAADTSTDELCGVLLFLRQIPADAAKYEVGTFDSDTRTLKKQALEVKGPGRMKDESIGVDLEAWVAGMSDGKQVSEVYFDPKDRSLLGVKSVDRGFWVVKKGLAKPKEVGPVPDIKKDAKSAKDVGMRFAMGILVGDIDVIGEVFHWKSMTEAVKEQMGMEMDEEMLKTMVTEQIKGSLKEMKPEQAWGIVKGAVEGAEETAGEGGAVKVKMGAPFQQVAYTAKEIDGKWLITAMEAPK